MSPALRIEEDDAQRLIERYDRQNEDPLELQGRCRDTCEGVAAFCGLMLEGSEWLPTDAPLTHVNAASSALLAHFGIHPAAAAAIAEAARGIGIVRDGTDDRIELYGLIETSGRRRDAIELPFDGLQWDGERLLVPRLPATIVNAINGGDESPLLRTIVSHPALDPLPLSILWMEDAEGGTAISLDNDHDAMTRGQLDAAWRHHAGPRR